MSMREIERKILAEAKQVFVNPKLRLKDLLEWSTAKEVVEKNADDKLEVFVEIPKLGVWVCILRSKDKRG